MARVTFVTGSMFGVGNLQHWRADTLLNTSLIRSVRMTPSSDDPHSVFLTDRSEAVPKMDNITVRGILEKSWSAGATESRGLATLSVRSHRHDSQPQPYQGQSREWQSQGTFSLWRLDLISSVIRMNGGTLR
jgi:hypothetical protein